MGDIVPIADKAKLQPRQFAFLLADSHEVRHRLTGMRVIGKSVYDGNRRRSCEVDGNFMSKSPDHDPVDHTLEILGHVVNRFTFSKTDVGGEKADRESAQLMDPHVERDACAK